MSNSAHIYFWRGTANTLLILCLNSPHEVRPPVAAQFVLQAEIYPKFSLILFFASPSNCIHVIGVQDAQRGSGRGLEGFGHKHFQANQGARLLAITNFL